MSTPRLPGRRATRFALLGGAAAALIAGAQSLTWAADHNDPVRVQATGTESSKHGDPAADIADIFTWYTGKQGAPDKVVFALTWRVDPLFEREFDPTVRYGIHIDNNAGIAAPAKDAPLSLMDPAKLAADHEIWIWFGKKKGTTDEWGLIVSNVPGLDKPVVGPVGKTLEPKPGVKIMAGLFDDPFFFDLDGFFNSLAVSLGNPQGNPQQPKINGSAYTLRPSDQATVKSPFGFVNKNDGFGKNNVHAVIIELPAESVLVRDGAKHKDLHVWATTDSRPDGRDGPNGRLKNIGQGPVSK
ncbi:MAG TPA: DUF4331 family protein [Labilithrix sp.]|nr:DUF4331 family protein [Labilithrix sp.]